MESLKVDPQTSTNTLVLVFHYGTTQGDQPQRRHSSLNDYGPGTGRPKTRQRGNETRRIYLRDRSSETRLMNKPRRRSLEVACIYKVRDANRAHDLAWQTFTGAADRTRMTEYLNDWQTAENKVARCRSMSKAASSVAIRRSRHGLMLAAARHGVDAYALLDWETNSPEQLANDLNSVDKIVSGLTDSSDFETQASRSLQIVNDSGPNAPPISTEVHHD